MAARPPGPHDPQHHLDRPAGGRPALPLAGPGPRGGRLGPGGPVRLRGQRLRRRLPRPAARPDLQGRRDPRPGRRPALHPLHRHRPRGPRHHPVVGGGDPARPRRVPVVPGAVPADPRLQLAAGALPGQGRHRQPALRLPAPAARRRHRDTAHAGQGVRLGVRDLGHRPLLVGRPALRLAGAQAAGRPRPKGARRSMVGDGRPGADAVPPPRVRAAARLPDRDRRCDEDYALHLRDAADEDRAVPERRTARPPSRPARARSRLVGAGRVRHAGRHRRRADLPQRGRVGQLPRLAGRAGQRPAGRAAQRQRDRPTRCRATSRERRAVDLVHVHQGRDLQARLSRLRRRRRDGRPRAGRVCASWSTTRPARPTTGSRCSPRTCRSWSTGCGWSGPRRSRSTGSGSPP